MIGFLMICIPIVESIQTQQYQRRAVQTMENDSSRMDRVKKQEERQLAISYNKLLYQCKSGLLTEEDCPRLLLHDSYEKLLCIGEAGIMGSLQIPKIDVDLPIYHGTSQDALQHGAGHQEGSSLPIGEGEKHVVLTGHRGLPSAKLFTRIDELCEGDLFFLKVLGEVQAYQVKRIQVLSPDEAAVFALQIAKNDRVSLITCTPYGINTQRLVVTGERVPYEKAKMTKIKKKLPSVRELLFVSLPFWIVCGLLIEHGRTNRRRHKHETQISGGNRGDDRPCQLRRHERVRR